jgi:hypothetical protein
MFGKKHTLDKERERHPHPINGARKRIILAQ